MRHGQEEASPHAAVSAPSNTPSRSAAMGVDTDIGVRDHPVGRRVAVADQLAATLARLKTSVKPLHGLRHGRRPRPWAPPRPALWSPT